MIVVNQYTLGMFSFPIIEEVIMCVESVYMSDAFLMYCWGGMMFENDCVNSVYMRDAFLTYCYILIILKSIVKSIKTKKKFRIKS